MTDRIQEYRIATEEEREAVEIDEDSYDLLVGPNGFQCCLTEPEDRTFYRDLSPIIGELNRLRKWQSEAIEWLRWFCENVEESWSIPPAPDLNRLIAEAKGGRE